MSAQRLNANEGVYAKALGGGGVVLGDLLAVGGDVQYGGELVDAGPGRVVAAISEVRLQAAMERTFAKRLYHHTNLYGE